MPANTRNFWIKADIDGRSGVLKEGPVFKDGGFSVNVKYKIWTCKIVVVHQDLPTGFDAPPRMAAENAIEAAGIKVLANFSGWGGKLNKYEKEAVDREIAVDFLKET